MKRIRRFSVGAVALAASLVLLPTSGAFAEDDPALEQTVSSDEQIAPAGEKVTIEDGHIDLGPLLIDEQLELLARDDREVPPVWRHLDDMVFRVGDAAKQVLPEGGDYDFTGATAGQTVWAIPQTQIPDVPWLGWSTQSPPVTEAVQRGVNLEYNGHQGPGQFTLFLQGGNFGAPQQLWSSANPEAQAVWVDLKTHTHANWVFTEPGIHLVKVTLKATMVDGSEVARPIVMRFAVGDADPAEAAAAQWQDSEAGTGESSAAASEGADSSEGGATEGATDSADEAASPAAQTSNTVLLVSVAMLGLGALAALAAAVIFWRNRRVQRDARQQVEGQRE